ncbi:8524_t:CDS:1, partial [Cetraspora pellucida]
HFDSQTYKKNKKNYKTAAQNGHFQTLEDSLSMAKSKKIVMKNLVKVFIKTNISLEKVNMLQLFFRKYYKEGDLVPQADALR